MKCTKCHMHEATYSCPCLEVKQTSSSNSLSTYATGIKMIGLCGECQQKLAKKHKKAPPWNDKVLLAIMVPVVIFYLIYGFAKLDIETGIVVAIGTSGLAIAGIISAIDYFIFGPKYMLKEPYRLMPWLMEDQRNGLDGVYYVPLVDGIYKNKKEFGLINNNFIHSDAKKKIYEKYIKDDEWKKILIGSALMQGEGTADSASVPNGGDLLTSCVNRLLELYRRQPEGYLTTQADEVRQVGRELAEAGGMALMLKAHSLFSQQNPRMARNLEMVWDGIGGWMG